MSEREQKLSHRDVLGFAGAAEEAFRFLSSYGFRLQNSDATILRYVSERVFLNVYHGRSSYELGIEVGLLQSGDCSDQGYPLGAFVGLTDQQEAARLRYFMTTKPEEVRVGLQRLAGQVKQWVERALVGDETVFAELRQHQQEWSKKYAAEVLAGQVRPKAEEAFRARDYKRVVEFLSKIEHELTPAERQKLEYARRHIPGLP
jgi:hypothetical protein